MYKDDIIKKNNELPSFLYTTGRQGSTKNQKTGRFSKILQKSQEF